MEDAGERGEVFVGTFSLVCVVFVEYLARFRVRICPFSPAPTVLLPIMSITSNTPNYHVLSAIFPFFPSTD